MLLGGKPLPKVRTQLCHHCLDGHEIYAVDAERIHSCDALQLRSKIE